MKNLLFASPLMLGLILSTAFTSVAEVASPKIAIPELDSSDKTPIQLAKQPNQDEAEDSEMDQVTSVSQLSDVQPTDWAFQALQSLVERYGCIAGYPDGTFKGQRALTRFEFAAGVNACLDRVTELIAASTANLVTKQDLATLQRLQEEFAIELATLRGRVDALEARTAELEATQFSTTTKLNGEVVFALASVFSGQDFTGQGPNLVPTDVPRVPTLGYRARLNFDTSFNGEDLLRTRLQSTNQNNFFSPVGTSSLLPEGSLRFDAGPFGEGSSSLGIDALLYGFNIGENTRITIEANAGASDDFAATFNPFIDGDGGTGAFTNFATRNSIYYYIGGAGLAIQHQFGEVLEVSLGYLAGSPNNPAPGNGLFNGSYGAIGQLVIKPFEQLQIGLTYINAYNTVTGTGSFNSNLAVATGLPVVTNSYGVQASLQLSPNFVISGWGGYTAARVIGGGDAEIWTYAGALAFPDLGRKGNLLGIVVGVEPKLTGAFGSLPSIGINADPNTSLHVEGFYTYQITDNIGITPGVIWLTAPNHNEINSDIIIGVIRTTFVF